MAKIVGDAGTLIESRLADLPPRVVADAKAGFSVSSKKISADRRRELFLKFTDELAQGRNPQPSDVADVTDITVRDANLVVLAFSLLFGISVEIDASASEVLQHSASLYEPEDVETVRDLIEVLTAHRKDLKRTLGEARLAGAVVPSLSEISLVVDLRVRFEGNDVAVTVPIVLANIETDSDSRLLLQLTEADVSDLIGRLEEAKSRLALLRLKAKALT